MCCFWGDGRESTAYLYVHQQTDACRNTRSLLYTLLTDDLAHTNVEGIQCGVVLAWHVKHCALA